MKIKFITAIFLLITQVNFAQKNKPQNETTELKHFMPLYLDIPAEMNVRKGFKELNIAAGHADFKNFSGQRALVEYDFSPTNNLGFEIEVPFIFVQEKSTTTTTSGEDIIVPEEGGSPKSAMALRLGFSYTLVSSKKTKTSLCAGYFNEFELTPFEHFGKPLLEGNVYNPFIAVGKIWGKHLHTMIYTGPAIKESFELHQSSTAYRFNTIVAYKFGKENKENFAGIECNQTWGKHSEGQMILRPETQLQLTEKYKLGIVGAIPIATANHLNTSIFLRFIYSIK